MKATTVGHGLAACRLEDVQHGAYLTDGTALIRVLAREGGIVWYEDALDDEEHDLPRRGTVTSISRSFRVVRPQEFSDVRK